MRLNNGAMNWCNRPLILTKASLFRIKAKAAVQKSTVKFTLKAYLASSSANSRLLPGLMCAPMPLATAAATASLLLFAAPVGSSPPPPPPPPVSGSELPPRCEKTLASRPARVGATGAQGWVAAHSRALGRSSESHDSRLPILGYGGVSVGWLGLGFIRGITI